MQASAPRPAAQKHMAMAARPATTHPAPEPAAGTPAASRPVASVSAKPVPGTVPGHAAPPAVAAPAARTEPKTASVTPVTKPETVPAAEPAHPVVTTHYVREKEGRVIYSGKGFRVQIYSGNDREKAIMVKTEFMRRFPAIRTYLSYVAPTFRVKVGNYRNRSDAAGMQREAKEMYSPCVIVPDNITINSR